MSIAHLMARAITAEKRGDYAIANAHHSLIACMRRIPMIVRAMLVMDLFVPMEPEEGSSYADPMEAFLVEAQAEFDRLMAEDPKFREFIDRTSGKFVIPNKPVLMLQHDGDR